MIAQEQTLLDFLKNTPHTKECVLWPFGKNLKGYGMITFGGKRLGAHRVALILHTATNPGHMDAAHGPCHNPSCVNPLHLSWKTRSENTLDRNRDGTAPIGSMHGGSKLLESDVVEIRKDRRIQKEIAQAYGITRQMVSMIKLKKSWTHV